MNKFFSFLLLFGCVSMLQAQDAKETFGKNRVQYKNFQWRYYSSDNFDIYFYDNGQDLAKIAAEYLEEEFDRITDLIGYAPYNKTEIFLYNSDLDMQQSNVGVNENNFAIGGQTNFAKSYVEIAYTGLMDTFKKELIYGISTLFIRDMMYGGSITDMVQNAYLLTLPDWFIDGAALYIAEGWSMEMDDFVREVVRADEFKNLNRYTGRSAALMGQSIWNFVAEQYGRANISNILNHTRITRNEQNSFGSSLGVSFKSFLLQWESFYSDMSDRIDNNYIMPKEGREVIAPNDGYRFTDVKFSPDGRYLAYSQIINGRYKVRIKDLQTGKTDLAHTGGYKVINQDFESDLPLIDWQGPSTLGIVGSSKGNVTLWFYNLSNKKKNKIVLSNFNHVKSIDFSPSGNTFVMSGDYKGQNDIFIYSITRGSVRRLTNDIYDDINPRFLPTGGAIVFSSNRDSDTLGLDFKPIEDLKSNFNLFYYHLDTSRVLLTRITNTISDDVDPIADGKGRVFFLSDQKGIANVFSHDINTQLTRQTSNFASSIKAFDIDFSSNSAAFIINDKGREYIYLLKDVNLDRNIFTPQTIRRDVEQARFLSSRVNVLRRDQQTKQDDKTPVDSSAVDKLITPDAYEFDVIEAEPEVDNTGLISTEDYVFEADVKDQVATSAQPSSQGSALLAYRNLYKNKPLEGPLPYQPSFMANNLITSFLIDPLLGFGIQLEVQLNDMLENNKFYGGVWIRDDLNSSKLYGEYEYLKHRVDMSVRFDRDVYDYRLRSILVYQKYTKNIITFGLHYPFNVKSRISLSPFVMRTQGMDLDPNNLTNGAPPSPINQTEYYGGLNVKLTYDNTTVHGLNLLQGFRGMAQFTVNDNFQNDELSFSKFTLDLRNYQRVHREIVFATRLYYGAYLGNQPQSFLLGGMNNWIGRQEQVDENNVPLPPLNFEPEQNNSRMMFLDYVTSLRGFDYNRLSGTNALLFNAEIRFPIIKYFHRTPTGSNFLNNLLFIGFYDIGSAWTGNGPFSEDNDINVIFQKPKNSPFQAEVRNFSDPWISGYGWGIRTVLLGYYMKFDMAWPVENRTVKDTKLYFTIGYDF